MAWTNLSFAYGSVLTSTKMTQMYDNFAYGAGSTNPTFLAPALGTPASGTLDNCTSNTEAVGTNSTQLATTAFCEAGFVNNDVGFNAVGSIALVSGNSNVIASGGTIAGGSIRPAALDVNGSLLEGSTLSGTWRNLSCAVGATYVVGVFQRIS